MDQTLTFSVKYDNPNEDGPRFLLVGGCGIATAEAARRYFNRQFREIAGVKILGIECLGWV